MEESNMMKPDERMRSSAQLNMTESMIWNNMASPCKRAANSLYFSKACCGIYIILLGLNCGLAVWAVYDLVRRNSPNNVFYICETVINSALLVDVMLRLWIKGCYKYWHECTCIFEFFVVWACIIMTVLSFSRIFRATSCY